MPLIHFLYRCPWCGQDPLDGGDGDTASCPACFRRYERGDAPGRIRVTAEGREVSQVPAYELSRRLNEMGGPVPRAACFDGTLEYDALVEATFSTSEVGVRWQGTLMGFFERFNLAQPGWLRLEKNLLRFTPEGGGIGDSPGGSEWRILDIRSLQAVSSALQMTGTDGILAQFRFVDDSPRRWEDLMRAAVVSAWREAGKGDVVEFQPRIRAR